MKIEMSLHALRLKNVAGTFKGTSDPFAVVTKIATEPGKKPEVLGKTEVIKNNLSPNWVKVFIVDYELGSNVKVAVSIFDEVRKSENLPMGCAVFDIAEVLGARGNTKGKRVKGGGTLYLHVRKSNGSGVLRLKMAAKKLKNVEGLFSKSDPFFELSRKLDAAGGKTWDSVYRSEWLKKNLNPEWEEAAVDLSILTEGDFKKPILINIYDHESKGNHTPMGELEITVNGLKAAAESRKPLAVRLKGKDAGELYILKADVSGLDTVTQKMAAASISSALPTSSPAYKGIGASTGGRYNFLDYIAGGCELNVVVAIDFTGSNGDPRQPGTLHCLNSGQHNDYETAINAIVSILSKYDTDKKFPVWGFGAKYGGEIQHCFQCGGADQHLGVEGVLRAYHAVFKSGLVMSRPTVFVEVIRAAAQHAANAHASAQAQGGQCYTILLILTDGSVSDVQATARALEDASNDPISVVIVGLGNDDFSGMRFLDNFSGPGTGKRDIAQFVAFNQHRHNSQSLTRETLNEIPNQLSEYFASIGVRPNPPIQRSDSSISMEEEEEIDLSLNIDEDEIVVAAGGTDFVAY